MSEGHELVLLTNQYPFGERNEPFLSAELEVLASRFRRVYVLPSHRAQGQRSLPAGVELVAMPWLDGFSRRAKAASLFSSDAARTIASTAASRTERGLVGRQPRRCAEVLARNILKARALRALIEHRNLREAVFYDYWFANSTLGLSLVRRSGLIRTAVARAHRFDIYDGIGGQIPFRHAKLSWLDRVLTVSDDGARYLAAQAPEFEAKITTQRLGVDDPGAQSPAPDGGVTLVVTCAYLRPEKRIHLVPEVLARLPGPVRWVHFGDGPEQERVQSAASSLPPRVEWSLEGRVPSQRIADFYRGNPVSMLLSVSSSEGLPVSMMEAQSYGIPIVACDVGGVREIVNQASGILIAPSASTSEIASAVSAASQPGLFDHAAIRGNFQASFSAEVNYNRLADALIALHGSEAEGDRQSAGAGLVAQPD